MLPLLPPLLKQWQQQWQHSIAATGWGVAAATAAEKILLCRHRRGGYCCPARGCHTNHNRDFSKNDYISNVKMTVTDIGTTSATMIYTCSSYFKLFIRVSALYFHSSITLPACWRLTMTLLVVAGMSFQHTIANDLVSADGCGVEYD